MLSKIYRLFVPSRNERNLKAFGRLVQQINDLEGEMEALSEILAGSHTTIVFGNGSMSDQVRSLVGAGAGEK